MMSSQRRGPWSQREDDILMHLVRSQGPISWVRISQQLHSRSPKQCRERYHQNLKPSLNHEPITAEEGAMIEKLVGQLGKRWAEIARRLHNRSDNAVKNWWNGSMNRRKRMIRRKAPGVFDDMEDSLSCPRIPKPLALSTMSRHPVYSHYGATSPSCTPFVPAMWNAHSGLLSPSTTSPSADSLDGAPSLMSDSSSFYSTSPRTGSLPQSPIALPPLRFGEGDSPASQTPGHSPNLPPLISGHEQVRLPPIRDCVEDRYQLPTAPSSPLELSLRLSNSTSHGLVREEMSYETNSRMKLSNLLT
ncbi:Homeodomain-like protein [Biscogniauxia mediterranea]|nr:Homeodomain-like protein [Biscogniauxia mediterranea]